MLRLRRNFKPRISNHLAVFSAILLLVTAFAGPGNTASPHNSSLDGHTLAKAQPGDPIGESLPALRKNTRRVSLMLFH